MSVLPFEPCSSLCISGQTGSGKTEWVYRFLKHLKHMYSRDPPAHILYCYGIDQPLFDKMTQELPHFTARKGLPTPDEIDDYTKERQHKLIVIDDLMHEVIENKDWQCMFSRGTHHRCVSIILITQNLFPQGKHARTIALNTWYMVLMKNLRDMSQVNVLGRQLYPGKTKGFMEAYQDALTQGYLVLDMSPHADDRYRLRTRVFPGEDPIVYQLT